MSQSQIQPAGKEQGVALYVLLAAVAVLVIYLFYAVIHPERF
ncbi:MAG: potassium-transporting ATPase subunit F [Bradyrhizobium sp.]